MNRTPGTIDVLSLREVNETTLAARRQLAGWRADAAAGRSPSQFVPQVSLMIDVLTTLLDEAPPRKAPVINRLIDDLEGFRKGLAH